MKTQQENDIAGHFKLIGPTLWASTSYGIFAIPHSLLGDADREALNGVAALFNVLGGVVVSYKFGPIIE